MTIAAPGMTFASSAPCAHQRGPGARSSFWKASSCCAPRATTDAATSYAPSIPSSRASIRWVLILGPSISSWSMALTSFTKTAARPLHARAARRKGRRDPQLALCCYTRVQRLQRLAATRPRPRCCWSTVQFRMPMSGSSPAATTAAATHSRVSRKRPEWYKR